MKLCSLALLGCIVFATSMQADYTKYTSGLVPAGLAMYGFMLKEGTSNKNFTPVMGAATVSALAMAVRLGMGLKDNNLLVARGVEVCAPLAMAYYVTTDKAKKALGANCDNCKCRNAGIAAGLAALAIAYFVQ